MSPLWLRARAPFAAYRWMQAGVYRATSPIMTPSAAYGLLLNLAGIDIRPRNKAKPRLRIAIGYPTNPNAPTQAKQPGVGILFQQLHSYPIGNSGKKFKAQTFGNKYWIAPARREILIDLDVILGVESNENGMLERICSGLRGTLDIPRYGLPFAGDNDLLFDRIDPLPTPPTTFWYGRLSARDAPSPGNCRLTVDIDREDASKTTAPVFAPLETPTVVPPEACWTWTPQPP